MPDPKNSNPFLEIPPGDVWGPGSREMALPLIEAVGVTRGMRVLEVGGGSGAIAVTLAKHFEVTVFTLEPWFGGNEIQKRAVAAGVGDRVIAIRNRAQSLVFADETFDAVISIGSFEMIGPDRLQALEQMVRVAKRGARIGIAEPMCLPVPIPTDLRELDRAQAEDQRQNSHLEENSFEYHFRSTDWNAELFAQTGLAVIESSYFPEAQKWWTEYAAHVREPERKLIEVDGGRWMTLGMVVGEKRTTLPPASSP